MHKGVFIGKNAENQQKRILILAESHHNQNDSDDVGKEASYTTDSVLRNNYYVHSHTKDLLYDMFDKIVRSFGYDPDRPDVRENFWEKVYFGNYIPVVCGVKTAAAENLLKDKANCTNYNNRLFDFVNENDIDVIFCFSRRVYSHLPKLSAKGQIRSLEDLGRVECGKAGRYNDRIDRCRYFANTAHGAVYVLLKKELAVFGMMHPSGYGYKPTNYTNVLKAELKRLGFDFDL